MPLTIENRAQPRCSVSAFGRVFFGAKNRLYFSQVYTDDVQSLGKMYQRNDPTSPENSDILPTDGGEIRIPEAGDILQLVPFYNGIAVLAENGCWYLGGGDGGFSANTYRLQKLNPFSCIGRDSAVQYEGDVLYASSEGIMLLSLSDSGVPFSRNITQEGINTFYEDFVQDHREDFLGEYRIVGALDPVLKIVLWINTSSPYKEGNTEGLMFDLRAQGWYPMMYPERDVSSVTYVRGRGIILASSQNLHCISEEDLIDQPGDVPYPYFIQTQPETLGQFTHKKGAPNMYAIFRKTEEVITGYQDNDWVYDRPSACTMTILFDFDKDDNGNRSTKPKEIYKANRRQFWPPSFPHSIDSGASTVEFRDVIRGQGKAVQFRFEGTPGKDMQLLGYSVEYSVRGRQ